MDEAKCETGRLVSRWLIMEPFFPHVCFKPNVKEDMKLGALYFTRLHVYVQASHTWFCLYLTRKSAMFIWQRFSLIFISSDFHWSNLHRILYCNSGIFQGFYFSVNQELNENLCHINTADVHSLGAFSENIVWKLDHSGRAVTLSLQSLGILRSRITSSDNVASYQHLRSLK